MHAFLMQVMKMQEFSGEAIEGFKRGFQLLEHLKLPENVLFDPTNLSVSLDPLSIEGLHCSHIM